jgi:hypothetical protein
LRNASGREIIQIYCISRGIDPRSIFDDWDGRFIPNSLLLSQPGDEIHRKLGFGLWFELI